MYRNDTHELWYWSAGAYATYNPSYRFDYQEDFARWMGALLGWKVGLLVSCTIGYAFLSLVNGLLLRIAIICSNVIIFPLLTCARSILRN